MLSPRAVAFPTLEALPRRTPALHEVQQSQRAQFRLTFRNFPRFAVPQNQGNSARRPTTPSASASPIHRLHPKRTTHICLRTAPSTGISTQEFLNGFTSLLRTNTLGRLDRQASDGRQGPTKTSVRRRNGQQWARLECLQIN